jgi:phosphoenolpyruvate carboxykinase (ATP)
MLGEKLKKGNINVWLINTGWSGGPYGTDERIKLQYTRAMITAALDGSLDKVRYEKHPVFKLKMPTICPQVPDVILNPKNTWNDPAQYDKTANKLAAEFIANFKHYETFATPEMIADAPACGHPHSPEETSK